MASSTITLPSLLTLCLFFLAADGHTLVKKCPNKTPICSHGQCLKHIHYSGSNVVEETECICDPNYYGKACTILIETEWDKSEVVSPVDTSYFSMAHFGDDSEDEFGEN
ncbi:unnamed protein product [Rodentolepis nana]|uniref:EGF-like domain-containing protein n=1 Tax=Rodentolepis nana TaxID=102285 RepID=A0A0R3T476_RODNA|nr:unnamed protein product [Rodentolepis nana]